MHDHTKFGYKRLNGSEDTTQTNIQFSLEPSLWPWHWSQQSNSFAQDILVMMYH